MATHHGHHARLIAMERYCAVASRQPRNASRHVAHRFRPPASCRLPGIQHRHSRRDKIAHVPGHHCQGMDESGRGNQPIAHRTGIGDA